MTEKLEDEEIERGRNNKKKRVKTDQGIRI